ncbi:WecB/TagA/CpsF family glycosyltransferase [uncultured Mucilaginibacter sp.]|uniref:WecB/TagA/CpsF family glycosyltransferase n=1 Tax=uncultured Mucilaginibacter sp. TaxID=797541 RepID=UPI0025D7EC38|nr:WecB/TagA/CpsF family glycosyltransferase [uncultured Mucilaginibacter sp.]
MLKKERILSIDISRGKRDEFVQSISDLGRKKKSSYVCVANAHMLVEAHWSKDFQRVVNEADIVTPDGMPLAKSFKILHGIEQERVDGMSLLPSLLECSIAEKLAVYFYGGSSGLIEHTRSFVEKEFPLLNVVGMYSPPFRYLTEAEETIVIDKIATSGANIVFVALGCPKQEQWMAEMKDKIPAVLIGIGGALPVLIGLQKRAPVWMQKSSLEWLYRLVREPRRLFKRYMVTNTAFLYLLFKEKIITRRVEHGIARQKISDPAIERVDF